MQMNAPAARNALDENRQGLMGKPIDRVEGRLKVMGKAPYAHEVDVTGQAPVHGYIVQATISSGSVSAIDTSKAERAPGVLLVMTHLNAPASPVGAARACRPLRALDSATWLQQG